MVQFNLLPDVKLQYIKTQRNKHIVIFVSTVAAISAAAVLALSMLTVYVVQKKYIAVLDKDIKNYHNQLRSVKDIDKMLTVQTQLNSLTGIHESKPVSSRMFAYVQQMTPKDTNLSGLKISYEDPTMTLSGIAPSLDSIKVYADALKNAKYNVGNDSSTKKAFTSVVLTNFGRDDKGATFTITAKFDPDLFSVNKDVHLLVSSGGQDGQSNLFQEVR